MLTEDQNKKIVEDLAKDWAELAIQRAEKQREMLAYMPKDYPSLYDLELKVLKGTASDDPSYDRGVVDGAQAVLLMVLRCMEHFPKEIEFFLDTFAQQEDIEPDSWIWELVVDYSDRETLGEYAARTGIPRTKAEVKTAKERTTKRLAEFKALAEAKEEAREVLDEIERAEAKAEKEEMG
jgi:hypothetical protein